MNKLTERQAKAVEAFPAGWFGQEVTKMSSRELRSLVAKGVLEYQPSENGFTAMPKYRKRDAHWQSRDTAPKDGTHILVKDALSSFGFYAGKEVQQLG